MFLWLIPICLFWPLTAGYLGGFPIDIRGGSGPRHLLGVVLSFVLFVAVWRVLNMVFGTDRIFAGMIVPSAISALALPLIVKAAFAVFGIRIALSEHAAAH